MLGIFRKLAAIGALCVFAAACSSAPRDDLGLYATGGSASSDRIQQPEKPLQCVPFARQQSGVTIYGDAYTWWDQAAGRYARNYTPATGSILVLDQYAGPRRAHLAVVRTVMGPREIRIDHANWLDEGNIHLDDPVMDVSAENDWTQVKVFNLRTGAWGTRIYHVKGFIGPGPAEDRYEATAQIPISN